MTQPYDPVLISLVRRAMPSIIAYDICGVQPMTGPTGAIFRLRTTNRRQVDFAKFQNNRAAWIVGSIFAFFLPLALGILS